jgi:hypothetical protein
MNICDIITRLWTCRQPDHLGSRSDCQAIGTAWSDASVDLKTHASGLLLLLLFLHTTLALILRYFFNLMSYQVSNVFDSHWRAHHRCQCQCQLLHIHHVSDYFILESWTVCIPRARCTVHESTLLNGRLDARETPVTATVGRFGGL